MNVNLTSPRQTPARVLAQMRLAATTAGLPMALATAFADGAVERGMNATMAAAAAQGLSLIATTMAARQVDDATLVQLTDDFLTKVMGGANPDPTAIANEIVMSHLAAAYEPINRSAATVDMGYRGQRSSQGQSWDSPHGIAMKAGDALMAALGPRMGITVEPTIGRDMGPFSLGDAAMNICRAAGLRPQNSVDAIRMAGTHSISDFAYAVQSGLTGIVGRGFQIAVPAISRLATEIPAIDYRQRNSVELSSSGMPMKVNEGGEVKFVTVSEKGELAAKPDDYASMFSVSNQALANDASAMGLLANIGRKMIQGSVAQYRNVLLAPLLANAGAGQTMLDTLTLFHATHANLAGTAAAISVASIGLARTAMRRQVDVQGVLLAIEPKFLLVPPEQETLAQQLVAQITAAKLIDVNPFTAALEVVCEPGLSNTTAWYLVGDPSLAAGLTWASLEGNSSPRIDSQYGWKTLGMEFRLQWAIGAAFVETASWYKNAGV